MNIGIYINRYIMDLNIQTNVQNIYMNTNNYNQIK